MSKATASGDELSVSFEFFPPKSEAMEAVLWESISRLEPLDPAFVSVTYGAGGSAAHLTCVSATRCEVDEVIQDYWNAGVRHIVALRGDPPQGLGEAYHPTADGYANAAELAAGIRAIGDFEISVGCYPEQHPESPSAEHDLDLLKAITQFFFEPETFLRFRDRVERAGITIPIVPGIMLQPNFKGLTRIAGLCNTHIPDRMHRHFDGLDDDPATRQLVTAHLAAQLCGDLREAGVNDFHFYTLNRAELALSTCHLLGVKPKVPATEIAA